MDVVEGFFDGKIEDKLNFEEDGVVVEIFVGLYFVFIEIQDIFFFLMVMSVFFIVLVFEI